MNPTTAIESFATPAIWAGFVAFIVAMLFVDLFLLGGNKAGKMRPRQALAWVVVWSALACTFGGLMWVYLSQAYTEAYASQKTMEFFAGYLIEQTLSIDNMFVFVMIFTFFNIPGEFQRRVLLWGVIGAIIMRTIMIFLGVYLISQFSWILYVFGAFLVITAIKMMVMAEQKPDLENHIILKFLRRHIRITPNLHQEKFWIRKEGLWWATPLFIVLLFIELTDLIFAVDSIPAIFAVTRDPFIVFTANMFAIMGLRALFFLLANMNEKFHLLKYGLAVILLFIGTKLIILPWVHIPIALSLSVVVALIIISIVASLIFEPKPKHGVL